MEKGTSLTTRFISRALTEETKQEIDVLVLSLLSGPLTVPNFEDELKDYYEIVTIDDGLTLRRYTSYEYKAINTVLRGDVWDYEVLGKRTEERVKELLEYADDFSSLIDLFPRVKSSFMTYRGTTIEEFKEYGISTLEDLLSLKGKFLYEKGFTSTSIEESSSFYNKKSGLGVLRNIEVKYIIPEGSQDGIPLIKEEISYATNEMEYLLNKNSLSRVVDVKLEGNNAIITVVLIPRQLWDKAPKEDVANHQK